MKNKQGRLVLTHSTYIPGLIAMLEKLIQVEGIQTVTPAVIGSVRSHSPQFKLKISVPIRGGFKAIARQGKSVQEVFILTTLNQDQLESAIALLNGK
ncbi:metal-binding protein [Cyanobacteria bacterium FACHB-63]|nr:metal-binding protein [Cyanobacteria bacterium FACHB-63]